MQKTRESKKVIRARAKKKDIRPIEAEPARANKATCSMCQKHTNNPSYCGLYEKYVGKKQMACETFVR